LHPSHLVKPKQKSHWMLSFSVRSNRKLKHLVLTFPFYIQHTKVFLH